MSNSNNSSDSSDISDDEFDNVENIIDYTKFYQIQLVKDDIYKFSCVGFFKKDNSINIELQKFEHDDLYCTISSNIIKLDEQVNSLQNLKDNIYLFDMITMDVLKKDGKTFKLVLSVEMKDPDFEKENKGNLMIWLNYESKQIPLKTALTHPGNERLPYYIIAELKNQKINEIIYN
jgi:hypothetical protein